MSIKKHRLFILLSIAITMQASPYSAHPINNFIVSIRKPAQLNTTNCDSELNKRYRSFAISSPTKTSFATSSIPLASPTASLESSLAGTKSSNNSFFSAQMSEASRGIDTPASAELFRWRQPLQITRADEDEKQVTQPVARRGSVSRCSILKKKTEKPHHVQTLSGGEVLLERELFRAMSSGIPNQLSKKIPSAVLNYFMALGNVVPAMAEADDFDAEAIRTSLTSLATEISTANMYEYVKYAEEFGLKGLPLTMLLAKVIELEKEKQVLVTPPVEPSLFCCLLNAKVAPVVEPKLELVGIPSVYHVPLAKLYFLSIGKGLDFSEELLPQPTCHFSVAELYDWGHLPKRPQQISDIPCLDLSPYRVGPDLRGLELLPYLKKLRIIRMSPIKHLHFACLETNRDDVRYEDIVLCRFQEEDGDDIYPPHHKFAHIK